MELISIMYGDFTIQVISEFGYQSAECSITLNLKKTQP